MQWLLVSSIFMSISTSFFYICVIATSFFYISLMATSFYYIYLMATSFFYIYVMATSFFYIYIYIYKLTERPVVLLNGIFDLHMQKILTGPKRSEKRKGAAER